MGFHARPLRVLRIATLGVGLFHPLLSRLLARLPGVPGLGSLTRLRLLALAGLGAALGTLVRRALRFAGLLARLLAGPLVALLFVNALLILAAGLGVTAGLGLALLWILARLLRIVRRLSLVGWLLGRSLLAAPALLLAFTLFRLVLRVAVGGLIRALAVLRRLVARLRLRFP